jgi:hypothetical protein
MTQQSVRSACDRGSLAMFVKVNHRMNDQNLLSRAPPCFGRHVKLLVSAAFAIVSTPVFKEGCRQAGGRS